MWSPLLTISDHLVPANLWLIRYRITSQSRPHWHDRAAWRWWRWRVRAGLLRPSP